MCIGMALSVGGVRGVKALWDVGMQQKGQAGSEWEDGRDAGW